MNAGKRRSLDPPAAHGIPKFFAAGNDSAFNPARRPETGALSVFVGVRNPRSAFNRWAVL